VKLPPETDRVTLQIDSFSELQVQKAGLYITTLARR
jgi:hypothetical protein